MSYNKQTRRLRPEPVILEGRFVRLLPLAATHIDALCQVGLEPSLWRWTPIRVNDRAGMTAFVDEALAAERANTAVPFVIALRETGELVGSTRFMSMVPEYRRVEIGGTWITPVWQRSRVNTEAKYLMLRHAFEVWHCVRVELKTNAHNAASRSAILRLGAREEGTLRKHMLNADGTARDSVYFSIIDDDWPRVKSRLEGLLARDS